MDNLKEIIETLSTDDVKEFRIFINRQKRKKNRKDLDLFHILLQKESYKPVDIIKKLYDKPNKEAYHALRKRLIKHLQDFIVIKRMGEDTTAASSIMGMLSLAQYLFDQKSGRLAWSFLRKAEELAANNEQFDLLNSIFNLQIEQAHSDHADDLQEIIIRRDANKEFQDQDERFIVANSLIKQQLRQARFEGEQLDFDTIIHETYKKYELEDAALQRPKLLYSTISIARSAVLAKKDYFSFQPYILKEYDLIMAKQGFSKSSHYYKLSLLYMIAHVLYRNRKFEEALRYVEELGESIEEYNKSHFHLFFTRYVLLLAQLKSYQGQNQLSVELMESYLSGNMHRISTGDSLNGSLNLSVYYFQQEDFKKANKTLLGIHHTDKWCEKKMGKEWVLKKNLIEMIVQYEMGNDDIALNRIRSIDRYFADMFALPQYQRVKGFLGFIRAFINDPMSVTNEEFVQKAEKTLIVNVHEQEDIQAMTFYAWLKSKMYKQPYYEVLLEMVYKDSTENA
jgi:hypothetical protein